MLAQIQANYSINRIDDLQHLTIGSKIQQNPSSDELEHHFWADQF